MPANGVVHMVSVAKLAVGCRMSLNLLQSDKTLHYLNIHPTSRACAL